MKTDWIIDIFLWRKYFQEKEIFSPFKLKITKTRQKMNIIANFLLLIAKKYSSIKLGSQNFSGGS